MVTLKWLLFDFGRRDGQDQAARANSFVANVAFTRAHQKLIFAVSKAYFALGAARGRFAASSQALDAAATVEDAAVALRARGLATVVAVAQAQRQTAQARFRVAKAAGDERTAYANLIAAIGLAPDAHIDVADTSEQPLPPEPPVNLGAVVREALAHRPDVAAALGKVDAAEGALKSQRAAYYPTIALSAGVYQNMGALNTDGGPFYHVDKPGGSILLTLSLPLFDGGARGARVAIAQSEVAAARDSLEEVRSTAVAQVVSAYNDLKASLAEHAAAVALHAAATTAYAAAFDAYRQGVGTSTDVANEGAA